VCAHSLIFRLPNLAVINHSSLSSCLPGVRPCETKGTPAVYPAGWGFLAPVKMIFEAAAGRPQFVARDVAPSFYPELIGVWRSVEPCWAVVAAVRGAEPSV
jgi:hypothetical protein